MPETARLVFRIYLYLKFNRLSSAYETLKQIIQKDAICKRVFKLLLLTSYRMLNQERKSWKKICRHEEVQTDKTFLTYVLDFKMNMAQKIQNLCEDLSNVLNNVRLAENTFGSQLRLLVLKADINRFLCQIKNNEAGYTYEYKCLYAYLDASMFLSTKLQDNSLIRKEIALKFMEFLSQVETTTLNICQEAWHYFQKMRQKVIESTKINEENSTHGAESIQMETNENAPNQYL